ncbi:metal-binding protein [Paenibacillus swuensis]|uniref:Metal-binding protein n=1 Tax=Paenibacillus swuensis TaxID=1178515 RepID=A0A172TKQ5_9BACL|nr:YceD family protein [Paenibacillus swuensis]ANE47504.1 metal-binding protein [Paenibacillus swuensis]
MLFQFKELASKDVTQEFHERLDVDALVKSRRDVMDISPLQADLAAKYQGGIVRVEGELSADLTMACSRCLKPVKETVRIPFDEQFALKTEATEEDETDDIIAVKEERVDLKPYVEEALMLYLPFAPLCEEACKGLCPVCGADRNETECGCNTEKVDPRLAGLKDFFKQ